MSDSKYKTYCLFVSPCYALLLHNIYLHIYEGKTASNAADVRTAWIPIIPDAYLYVFSVVLVTSDDWASQHRYYTFINPFRAVQDKNAARNHYPSLALRSDRMWGGDLFLVFLETLHSFRRRHTDNPPLRKNIPSNKCPPISLLGARHAPTLKNRARRNNAVFCWRSPWAPM